MRVIPSGRAHRVISFHFYVTNEYLMSLSPRSIPEIKFALGSFNISLLEYSISIEFLFCISMRYINFVDLFNDRPNM